MAQFTAAQLANVALNVMAQGTLSPATDANLEAVIAARQFLNALSSGQLIVVEAPKPQVDAAVVEAPKPQVDAAVKKAVKGKKGG